MQIVFKEFTKYNKIILTTQHRFKSEKHIFFTEEINKIAVISNDDKRIQSVDSIEIYAYGMDKYLVCKKKRIILNNMIKQYKNNEIRLCYKRKYKKT